MIQINKDFPCNPSNYAVMDNRSIEYIVVHYVGATGTAKGNAKYFSERAGLNASAHFFVGHESENGAIYQSVDPKDRAWHCGSETGIYKHPRCRNINSIGLELCCHKDPAGNWYFDDVTVDQGAELVNYLMATHGIPIENVVRHYDVTGKTCPAPLVDEFAWLLFKNRLEVMNVGEKTGDNPSSWAKDHTEWAKAKEIIVGDGQGNYDWQGPVTRESLAAILHNYAIAYGQEKE